MLVLLYLNSQLRVIDFYLMKILIEGGRFSDLSPFIETDVASLLAEDLHTLFDKRFYLTFQFFYSFRDFSLNWSDLIHSSIGGYIRTGTPLTANIVISLSMPSIIDSFL